jgi:Protein of unknown function (DUF3048) N-terminal domain/Protein of unknown function (DUF3048) C-terminal domain
MSSHAPTRALALSLALLIFIACDRGGPVTQVVIVQGAPTRAPAATLPFVAPTDTLIGPTDTARPPSETPTLVPSETATLEPSPTAVPQGQIGPNDFAADVDPLTGLTVADPNVLNRRPLAIKVSNYPACVRPQSGLSLADLVFEHYAEGPTTRFTAIFWSHDAPKVGSIRSARLIDLELPAMYQSLFAFSGASPGVLEKLKAADFKNYVLSPEFQPGHPAFFRVPIDTLSPDCQALEHTLFTGTDKLWADADLKNINQRPTIKGMAFNDQTPAGGQPAGIVALPYDGEFVQWNYSETAKAYYRYANGQQHKDTLTDVQISASNVVVVFANHVFTLILENLIGFNPQTRKGGSHSIEIQLWGTGPAMIFRDGQLYNGSWVRQDRAGVLGLVDASGQIFPLRPGNTWFELAGLDSEVKQLEDGSWQVKPTRLIDKP